MRFFGCIGVLISCGGEMIALEQNTSDVVNSDVKAEDTASGEPAVEYEDDVIDFCPNHYHPIHKAGWSKEFVARQEGVDGIAREEGLGVVVVDGKEIYQYRDVLETYHDSWFGTETHGWDTTISVSCGLEEKQGLFLLGWKGIYRSDDTWGQWQEISGSHTYPRKYLSTEYALGYEGSWDYEYDIALEVSIAGTVYPASQHITGTYQEVGFQEITLFDGTEVEAFKLVNTFEIIPDQDDPIRGYIEQYWVKGLGLVKETYINQVDSSEVLSKELSAYTGLEILE